MEKQKNKRQESSFYPWIGSSMQNIYIKDPKWIFYTHILTLSPFTPASLQNLYYLALPFVEQP